MICAFKAGLTEIGWIGLTAMAFVARRNMAGRTVVMASLASLIHTGHLGVNLMIEMDRPILINKLIQEHRIGRLGHPMLANIFLPSHTWTGLEAGIRHYRIGASMAFKTIHLELFHLLFRVILSPDARR